MADASKKANRAPRVSGKVQLAKAAQFLADNPNASPGEVAAGADITPTYARQAIVMQEFNKVKGTVQNVLVEGETVEVRRFAAQMNNSLAELEKCL